MPVNGSTIDRDLGAFQDDLRAMRPSFGGTLDQTLDPVAVHDFAFHELMFPTRRGYVDRVFSARALDRITAYEQSLPPARSGDAQALTEIVLFFESTVRAIAYAIFPTEADAEAAFEAVLATVYLDDATWHVVIEDVAALYLESRNPTYRSIFLDILRGFYRYRVIKTLSDPAYPANLPSMWLGANFYGDWAGSEQLAPFLGRSVRGQAPELELGDYPFEVFRYLSVNVGLRLIYRQEWTPLGSQPGEVVRTLPLGPGQKERVTTKIVRRRKVVRTSEMVSAVETSSETSDSTKDSNEIVQEAAESSKWQVDAKVSGSFFVSAEASTSNSGASEEKSRTTSSQLSESVHKAANKVRRETKVTVTTESEETSELETFSEIHNPNNEIALTYEYHKLQQQYEVFTYLAEVESVVFVAEQVPSPSEIPAWVRRYDWIIAKVLKDESFRAAMNELIEDYDPSPLEGISENPFAKMHDASVTKFASFDLPGSTSVPGAGLSIPDIYAEPTRIYQQELRDQALRKRANYLRAAKRERLFTHIADNILHYCRAVWSHEDPDQRLLRYKLEGRRVPIEWSAPFTVTRVGDPLSLPLTPTGRTAPLGEIIDPTGPLGYAGNYAVFGIRPRLREDPSVRGTDALAPGARFEMGTFFCDLETVLSFHREPYVRNGVFHDPAMDSFGREALRMTAEMLRSLHDEQVTDIASYLPELRDLLLTPEGRVIRNNGVLLRPPTQAEWGYYLYRKNSTRRFLVDSNNLYLSIRPGGGVALEPFKRAHRYVDVLKAYEELETQRWKNRRREEHLHQPEEYDPDVAKVIVVGQGAAQAALVEAGATGGAAPGGDAGGATGGGAGGGVVP